MGGINETTLIRDSDGALVLGQTTTTLKNEERNAKREADIRRLLSFVENHPGTTIDEAMGFLTMAKSHVLDLAGSVGDLMYSTGRGVKGDPKLYFTRPLAGEHQEHRLV